MAFATQDERQALRNSATACDFTLLIRKDGRESEIAMDDIDMALANSADWINRGAEYVEIFRIMPDGDLNPTIGGYYRA